MDSKVKSFLQSKGYTINDNALSVIKSCDDWYANRLIADFHKRTTVQGMGYELDRLNFAKRCCSDDANLCEILEINAGEGAQAKFVADVLKNSEFNTQYRKQLEKTSANGTVACYLRLDGATLYDDGKARGGNIKLNYVDADGFIPLTVENDIVLEAAFVGSALKSGKKQTTLVTFTTNERGLYIAKTHIFDERGNEDKNLCTSITLGDIKPFAVMRNAEVNNLDDMDGYGLPKLLGAIPILKGCDLCYNVLNGDLDKADKLLIVNDIMCSFDEEGNPITPNEQAKKTFVLIGQEKLPDAKALITEYNPKIRIEEITKVFELLLSLLSMMFGYGTKKYSFENGQITTATEYIGERQDQMQELNRQRQEATRYIQDICKAIIWFGNAFHKKGFNAESEILVDFDDSYVNDKATELERKRDDALSFDIPILMVWYLMDAYNLTEDEAIAYIGQKQEDGNIDETED